MAIKAIDPHIKIVKKGGEESSFNQPNNIFKPLDLMQFYFY